MQKDDEEPNENSDSGVANDHGESRDQNESHEDEYKRDESNRGEREGHLRQRSDWFQKRTGGR
jgi:hypothetical protein